MNPTARQAAIASLRAALDLLLAEEAAEAAATGAPVTAEPTTVEPADKAARQRQLKAERQRRWRASKASPVDTGASTEASTTSTGASTQTSTAASTEASTPSTKTSTASTEASTAASTPEGVFSSRACAGTFSSEREEKYKNKNPLPPVGGGVCVDETSRDGATRRRSSVIDVEAVEEPVRSVWATYAEVVGTRVLLSASRVGLIRQRLRDGWSAEELMASIRGYGASRWHFGENDRGRRFTDLELWLRDAKHVEAGLSMASKPQTTTAPTQTSSGAAMAYARSIEAQWEEWERQGCPGIDGKPTKPVEVR